MATWELLIWIEDFKDIFAHSWVSWIVRMTCTYNIRHAKSEERHVNKYEQFVFSTSDSSVNQSLICFDHLLLADIPNVVCTERKLFSNHLLWNGSILYILSVLYCHTSMLHPSCKWGIKRMQRNRNDRQNVKGT